MADNEEEVEMIFTPETEKANELIPIIQLEVYLLSVVKDLGLSELYDEGQADTIKVITKALNVITQAQNSLIKIIKEKDKQITL